MTIFCLSRIASSAFDLALPVITKARCGRVVFNGSKMESAVIKIPTDYPAVITRTPARPQLETSSGSKMGRVVPAITKSANHRN